MPFRMVGRCLFQGFCNEIATNLARGLSTLVALIGVHVCLSHDSRKGKGPAAFQGLRSSVRFTMRSCRIELHGIAVQLVQTAALQKAMGKRFGGKAVDSAAVRRRIAKVKQHQPFPVSVPRPVTMRDRQRSWMMTGLKHLRAPVASCLGALRSGDMSLVLR